MLCLRARSNEKFLLRCSSEKGPLKSFQFHLSEHCLGCINRYCGIRKKSNNNNKNGFLYEPIYRPALYRYIFV